MKKVINPCLCEVQGYNQKRYNAFVEICYDKDGLSLHGVIGPFVSGNCAGSAGQCGEEIRKGHPKEGWTREMLDKLCDIWEEWHLNTLRPYCQHQKELGWRELAREELTLYHYRLTNGALKLQKEAKRAAVAALEKGEVFTPTEEQTFFACLPYSLDIFGEPEGMVAAYYEPKKPLYPGDHGFKEKKTRGWVRYDTESEEGILCKPCPVCGYKYGSSWKTEPVPQEVIDWLFDLPDTTITPAWV